MADYKLGFKSAYIAAVEFGGKEPTLVIESVKLEGVADDKGAVKDRWAVRFRGTPRAWLLNLTNAQLLAAMWGRDTDGWVGHAVTLCAVPVRFGAETVDGIRVKGSPELTAPKAVEVKLPRKRPQTVRLVPTPRGRAPEAEPVEERVPGADDA